MITRMGGGMGLGMATGRPRGWSEMVTDGPGGVYIGDFHTDTGFNDPGVAWTIAAGQATSEANDALTVASHEAVVAGATYRVTFTIVSGAGTARADIGLATGTLRAGAGTYTEDIVATGSGSADMLKMVSVAGAVVIDNWSVVRRA